MAGKPQFPSPWSKTQLAHLSELGLYDARVPVRDIARRYVETRGDRTLPAVEARVWKVRREVGLKVAPCGTTEYHDTTRNTRLAGSTNSRKSRPMLDTRTMEQALNVCLTLAEIPEDSPDADALRAQIHIARDVRDAMLRVGILGLLMSVRGEARAPELTHEEQLQILGLLVDAKQTLHLVAEGEGIRPEAVESARGFLQSMGGVLQHLALRALTPNALTP